MSNGINSEIRELLALRYYARNIEFFNNQKVSNSQSGNRLSLAKGRGMDFDEVRRYQAGDDIRLMHWALTARLGKPFTKVYREERERSVYLIIDQSSSMQFGTRVCFKSVLAAKVASLLGFAALNHQEQVGGIIFNDQASEFIKPKTGRKPLLDLFNFLAKPYLVKHNRGGLKYALQVASQNIRSGSIVIIISDYFEIDSEVERYLSIIGQKSKLINIFTYDQLETKLPDSGTYSFTDSGQSILEINANKKNNATYSAPFKQRINTITTLAKKSNMGLIKLSTNDDLVRTLNLEVTKHG